MGKELLAGDKVRILDIEDGDIRHKERDLYIGAMGTLRLDACLHSDGTYYCDMDLDRPTSPKGITWRVFGHVRLERVKPPKKYKILAIHAESSWYTSREYLIGAVGAFDGEKDGDNVPWRHGWFKPDEPIIIPGRDPVEVFISCAIELCRVKKAEA